MNVFEAVKQSVTTRQAAEYYGIHVGRNGMACCPFHNDKTPSMNDGIDTLRDNNDIAPFKNILNEMYSKDISKKVHSSYLLKAQKGQFTGCLAPFGYRKDPEDKNHLLIDEETAPIVRLIFGYALNGHGAELSEIYARSRLSSLSYYGVRRYLCSVGSVHRHR